MLEAAARRWAGCLAGEPRDFARVLGCLRVRGLRSGCLLRSHSKGYWVHCLLAGFEVSLPLELSIQIRSPGEPRFISFIMAALAAI